MTPDIFIKSLKYTPKIWTALSFPLLLEVALILFFGRNFEWLRISWLLNLFPDFYSHISNFSILFTIYITMGYVGLWFGIKLKSIAVIGLVLLSVNFIIEFLVTFLNTPDMVDAVYGLFWVMAGFVYLYFIKRYGFNVNKLYEPREVEV